MKNDNDDDYPFGGLFRVTKEDRKRSESILETVMPSNHIPTPGSYFRMRFALIGDRSYLDNIWKCLAHQDGAVTGKVVHGSCYGDPVKMFVIGDVLFYDATEMWNAIQADRQQATA